MCWNTALFQWIWFPQITGYGWRSVFGCPYQGSPKSSQWFYDWGDEDEYVWCLRRAHSSNCSVNQLLSTSRKVSSMFRQVHLARWNSGLDQITTIPPKNFRASQKPTSSYRGSSGKGVKGWRVLPTRCSEKTPCSLHVRWSIELWKSRRNLR